MLALEPLQQQHTTVGVPLTMEKHAAITFWKLTIPDYKQSVANQFGAGRSTVGVVLMEVSNVVKMLLCHVMNRG